MGRIEKQKRELIEESNKRMLNEQEESNTISSKEILKLEKKEGWESVMGQLPISKIVTMSDNFMVVDGKGGTLAGAQLDAQTKQKQLGIKQKRLFVISKNEGNSVRVKFLITQ
jgi:hypothetical protein